MRSTIWDNSTPTREAKRETRLPLETKHMVDGNDVNNFSGGQICVCEYIVKKCRFRLHYERVLCRTQ